MYVWAQASTEDGTARCGICYHVGMHVCTYMDALLRVCTHMQASADPPYDVYVISCEYLRVIRYVHGRVCMYVCMYVCICMCLVFCSLFMHVSAYACA